MGVYPFARVYGMILAYPQKPAKCKGRVNAMTVTAILFDLDGTLLPLEQDEFTMTYIKSISTSAATLGYTPEEFAKALWGGTAAMVKNTGEKTNEQVFWEYFASVYGSAALKDIPFFDNYYLTEFQRIKDICSFEPMVPELIKGLQQRGLRLTVATNPFFPAVATRSRIRWAGLEPEDFELYTTYENSRHCKPDLQYYCDIMDTMGLKAQECIMVGNDVGEDMIAAELGMGVFLLTDHIVNRKNQDISKYPHGGFKELSVFLNDLL